jgi:hypothetical protein
MSEISQQEKKVTSASYFYSFYLELQQLNHNEAQYQNLMGEIRTKYKTDDITKIDEGEANIVMQQAQVLRYHSRKCWIMFKAISAALKWDTKAIQSTYYRIRDNYIISVDDIEEFIVHLNACLIDSTIQELLDKSGNLMEAIYAEKPSNNPPK